MIQKLDVSNVTTAEGNKPRDSNDVLTVGPHLVVCSSCHGARIYGKAVIDPNSNEILDSWGTTKIQCDKCEESRATPVIIDPDTMAATPTEEWP